ncbi:pili assembly chaperone [Escherichia coli]|nr:pili assembly chaperone [Escherichia coli]
MSFLFKLTIAILIVFAILFPILISSDNKLSALFWKIPKDFWVFLIIMYGAIITVVFIESSEQARIRRQQYLQQYKMPNEIHENVVIENSIISRETTDDESDINTLYLDSFKSKNNCKSFETNSNLLDKIITYHYIYGYFGVRFACTSLPRGNTSVIYTLTTYHYLIYYISV